VSVEPWISQGHVLFGATSPSKIRSEIKELSQFFGEVEVRENEDEIAFIKDIYVEYHDIHGSTRRVYPDRRFFQNNRFDIVSRGNPVVYNFDGIGHQPGARAFLYIEGYYMPFSHTTVQKAVSRTVAN
jgi:hypothetical protein